MTVKSKQEYRIKRHARVRRKISGTAARPRMAVLVSNKNMYVQFIDDCENVTLAYASTVKSPAKNVEAASQLGRRAAEVAKEKGIRKIVVDRGGFKFHGRVAAIVAAAIETGLCIRTEEKA